MLPIEEAILLTTFEEMATEIRERDELISLMVGQLYPAILKSEIMRLRFSQDCLQSKIKTQCKKKR